MIKILLIFLLSIAANINLYAQTDSYSAPVIWQRYAVSANGVSVLLPKLPVARVWDDICSQTEGKTYYAYADEVIYSLKITAKAKKKPPSFCQEKRIFSKKNFAGRLSEIRNSSKEFDESKFEVENREVIQIKSKTSTVWVFDDFENNRWFELSVAHRENAEFDKVKFFDSIKIGENPPGTEIGSGAIQVFGDEKADGGNANQTDAADKSSSEEQNFPVNVIVKPPPRYTDTARQNNVQGTITLRVVFLANGGIGQIAVTSDPLPFGLTEQAIAAAKKMAFLPQKSNGKPQTVVKSVQYSFSIY